SRRPLFRAVSCLVGDRPGCPDLHPYGRHRPSQPARVTACSSHSQPCKEETITMAQIGQFTRTPSGYSGRIRTLLLDLELTLVPTENLENENAPAYRIHLGDKDGPEVGAGWKHSGERAGRFISVLLDD